MVKLTDKEIEALKILKKHTEITSETAEYYGTRGACKRLVEKGMAHRFISYTLEAYTKKERDKIGFHGGRAIDASCEPLFHMLATYRITVKGLHALRKNWGGAI